jgi:hypothetical protein
MTAPTEVHDHPSGAKQCQHCKKPFRGRCPHCDFACETENCDKCKPMLKGFYWAFPNARPKKTKKKGGWRR